MENATTALWLQGLAYSSSGVLIFKYGGISKHLSLAFLLSVCFVFLSVAPMLHYFLHVIMFHGVDVSQYQLPIIDIYTWAILSINTGYWLIKLNRKQRIVNEISLPQWPILTPSPFVKRHIFFLIFSICMTGILLDIYLFATMYPWEFFNPFLADVTGIIFLYPPVIAAFNSLSDTLMVVLLLAVAGYKIKGILRYSIIIISVYTLFMLGFRYQLFLVVLAVILHFILGISWNLKRTIQVCAIGGLVIYLAVFMTLNRWAIGHKDYGSITFNPTELPISQFLLETGNCQTDAALMKYMVNHNIPHDKGLSSIGYSVLRFVPAYLFPEHKKPLPPVFHDMMQAVNSKTLNGYGALSLPMEYWYAFGTWGMVAVMLIIGMLLALIPIPAQKNSLYAYVYCLSITMLYQWITRGYTPQQVELLAFWAIGFLSFSYGFRLENRPSTHPSNSSIL